MNHAGETRSPEEDPRPTTTGATRGIAAWLDRFIVAWLFVFAFCAPHSIAATQLAWGLALAAWAGRCLLRPRPALFRTPLDYPLLTFFALTVISSFCSYDPVVSIGKLRAASLFTIVYLVAENIRSRRAVRRLALVLLASCLLNVIYTMGERVRGRGVKVTELAAASPLRAAGVAAGDTLLELDGRRLNRVEELAEELSRPGPGPARLRIYRFEWTPTFEVPRATLLAGETPAARLGINGWSRGRDWRASGFYGHYTTYAEVLQLIISLAFGLLVALERRRSWTGLLLTLALAGLAGALFLTVTRASWLSTLISAAVITLATGNRRAVLSLLLVALLVVPAGLFLLQQKRNVGFFDRKDDSIAWRQTVYREGLQLLVSRPRHLLVGIGMDSIKRYWREWGMFAGGRIPIGHMHSTPLQLALERGLPALAAWLALLVLYARMLLVMLRRRRAHLGGWFERGLALGALGGLVGFASSGMVHYNLGDSEVVMVFYFIMGIALVLERAAREEVLPAAR